MRGSGPRARRRLGLALLMAVGVAHLGVAPPEARPTPASADRPTASVVAAGVVAATDVERAVPPASAPGDGSDGSRSPRPPAVVQVVAPAPPYKVTAYTIRTLAPGALPYVSSALPSKTPPALHDSAGIPMKKVGTRLYYSPAGLAQYGLRYEDAYRRTGDADYLAIARKVLNKLMAIGVKSNGGLYIQYRFDFAMHRIATEVMKAPWYSAMAQGLALSLAVRLYRDTGEAVFKTDADLLFNSFKHLGRGSSPWVAYVDPARYLWLEEYPEPSTPSDHTANGFNFAVFGLYDYYQETKDPAALQILRGSLTTFRHYVASFRRPGTYSKYCLRHGRPQPKYHKIVTWQLVFLYKMSGDPYFLSMSKLFTSDYH